MSRIFRIFQLVPQGLRGKLRWVSPEKKAKRYK